MKTLMEKKRLLLEDEASDWLQIRTAASSFDVKGNKAIKLFLRTELVSFPKYGHIVCLFLLCILLKIVVVVVVVVVVGCF